MASPGKVAEVADVADKGRSNCWCSWRSWRSGWSAGRSEASEVAVAAVPLAELAELAELEAKVSKESLAFRKAGRISGTGTSGRFPADFDLYEKSAWCSSGSSLCKRCRRLNGSGQRRHAAASGAATAV